MLKLKKKKTQKTLQLKRIQGILWRHVHVTIVDITQHRLKGLLTRDHLTNGYIYLTVHGHEGAEHCLKVTEE